MRWLFRPAATLLGRLRLGTAVGAMVTGLKR
jgi:hypothetical protein